MATFIPRSPGHSAKTRSMRSMALAVLLCAGLFPCGGTALRAQTAGDSLYAVLFLGSNDYYVYRNDLSFAFKTLINDYGYTKENVIVLKRGGFDLDLDGDGLNDVDYSATKANLDQVFANLQAVMTNNDVCFFFATDHGYWSNSDCNDAGLLGYEDELIPEEDFVTYVDGLDSPTCRIVKILLFVTCGAGGMVPELKALDTPLMVSTASKACEIANYDDGDCLHAETSCNYTAYSFWWFSALHGSYPDGTAVDADENNDGYVSIHEAASFAEANDEYAQENANPKEHPLYWDSYCIAGRITTLKGELPNLPARIAYPYPCHGPWPCRWNQEPCTRGLSGAATHGRAPAGKIEDTSARLWADPTPAPGETTYVWARVRNDGDTPLTSATVDFYYADPTVSLIYPQSGLVDIGTATVPFLPPQGDAVVGPLPFMPPSGGNSFGEPRWTLMAVAEHYQSQVESGWLVDDDHVAAANRFEMTAAAVEPAILHLALQNPLDVPVKALLTLDDSSLPSGWTVSLNPAAGDTVELASDSSVPLEVTMTGVSGPALEGEVDVTLSLHTTNTKACESCEDSTCGGFIGEAGGCTVALVLESPVAVLEPEVPSALGLRQNYPNPFNPTTTIAFSLPEDTRVTLAIYDVNGHRVTTLVDGVLEAGFKEYRWDGTDSNRRPVGSGVYFYRLDAGNRTLVEKMVFLK